MLNMNKARLTMNYDSKPDYTRIPKDTIVEIVEKMPSDYVMIKWNKRFFPVPFSLLEVIEND